MNSIMSGDAISATSICYGCKALTCHGCANYGFTFSHFPDYDATVTINREYMEPIPKLSPIFKLKPKKKKKPKKVDIAYAALKPEKKLKRALKLNWGEYQNECPSYEDSTWEEVLEAYYARNRHIPKKVER